MSKRNSTPGRAVNNTLFNYFTKSPGTPKSINNTPSGKDSTVSSPSVSNNSAIKKPLNKKSLQFGKYKSII